jgi:alanine dehydrogenase
MGAEVRVISRGIQKLERIDELYNGNVQTFTSSKERIEAEVPEADVVIGAVLITGAKAPKLVSRELVAKMKKGAVIVDVSIDQGGCIETSRPTTHDDPVYTVDGVIHYTVANMPGAYPKTSTIALTEKTLKYIRLLAEKGIDDALRTVPLKSALNTHKGEIMHSAVSASLL